MIRISCRITLCCVLLTFLYLPSAAFAQTGAASGDETRQAEAQGKDAELHISEGERLFALKVKPLLVAKCFVCHGKDPDDIQAGLDLTTRDGMLKGGESYGPALVPGKADASLLYESVTWKNADLEMPPKENDRLTEAQTWAIRDWINAGAPWPDAARTAAIIAAAREEQSEGVLVQTSGSASPEWNNRRYERENLWAYRPLERPALPEAVGDAVENPIDAFLNRQLSELQLAPAPPASRRVLIRRVTYDLTGLPPRPEDVAAFLADPADDATAFRKVIERLLASPQYGEQWARHWLDVVRYADSAGFANDFERPNAWRYRDYVIRAFNSDKPYDEFVREQIAGDELDPTDPEHLIATGFLRMGPWEHTGMSVAKITRQQFLDDVTASVGQVFLSHPLQCARCHDHKFDPIPQRDYYAIQAVFASTQFADRDVPFLDVENTQGFEERHYLEDRLETYAEISRELDRKHEDAARQWYAERGREYQPRGKLLAQGVPESEIAPRHLGLTPADMGLERIVRKNTIRHRWELDRYRPIALSVYSGPTPKNVRAVMGRLTMPEGNLRTPVERTAILSGGDPFSPTEPVSPDVLSVVAYFNADSSDDSQGNGDADLEGGPTGPLQTPSLPQSNRGRRLAFADWLVSRENPLTARSWANRVWQYHFGRGLAANSNNFGAMGKKPTHPELLDWLAVELIENDWSTKHLHRLILTSAAWQRSADHPQAAKLATVDPDGVSYARFTPRRLAAEEIRDAMLVVSGELNPAMGGIPIRPVINMEAALQPRQIMGTYAPAYQPSPLPSERNRRSIYALKLRGLRDPFLEVFNQPSPDESCELRDSSTVTPQVFTLLNSRNSADRALAFAADVLGAADAPTNVDRSALIDRVFQRAFARTPTAAERKACLEHWARMTARHRTMQLPPRNMPTEIVREAVEEMSGETFAFTEQLDMLADYVPDLRPVDVDAQTRGLAEVCLVLFNSNEFVYVY